MHLKKNTVALSLLLTTLTATQLRADSPAQKSQTSQDTVPFQKSLYSKDTECFFSYGDWLYWKPTRSGILGISLFSSLTQNTIYTFQNTSGGAPSKSIAKDIENRLPYASGFRVGLGYRFKENYLSRPIRPWQIETSYERIYTASHKKTTASGYTSGDQALKTIF